MNAGSREKNLWGLGVVVVTMYAILPVLWIVSLSLKDPGTLADGRVIPSKFSLENYKGIFKTGDFNQALLNSFIAAAIATVLAVALAAMAAYALARLEFPGKGLILSLALAIAMFPPIAIVGALFDMWRNIGLFDTIPGLVIPYMTFTLPLAIYTLSAFFREIPWELEQAAQIDGATPSQAFRKVILPLAAPGVATTSILVFIFAWNDFLFSTVLTSTTRSRTVPATLSFFTGKSQFEDPTGSIAAAAVIVTIPIIVLVLFFQRRIVAGLTAGAVKG